MKKTISRQEAREKIEEFFKKKNFEAREVKKIKRLAMKHRISLKEKRKLFCKKCLSKLKGKTRINKTHKSIRCEKCGFLNRSKLRSK